MITASWKWDVLREAGRAGGLRVLVETGGYRGESMEYLRHDFDVMITVELGKELFDSIVARQIPNCFPLWGDSGEVLRRIAPLITDPVLWWLDAHYSHFDTVGADTPPALERELRAVLARDSCRDVILVDDVGSEGIEEEFIRGIVSEFPGWGVVFTGGIAVVRYL